MAGLTLALIMAGGDGTRWLGNRPKEVAPILGEPVIARTVRQLRERGQPCVVVSHKPEVHAVLPPVVEVYAERHGFYLECAWALRERWLGRNVVLFGDVAYTDEALDALLAFREPIWWVGRSPEMFGMGFCPTKDFGGLLYDVLKEGREGAGKLRGRCWNLYEHWRYRGRRKCLWVSVTHNFSVVPEPTGDMDTLEMWQKVAAGFKNHG